MANANKEQEAGSKTQEAGRRPLPNGFRLLVPAFWLLASFVAGADQGPMPPSNLRCEYVTNPLGIDVPQPRFFWVLNHTERDQKQSAYQVLVAQRPELLNRNQGDQWDSGKVTSEE